MAIDLSHLSGKAIAVLGLGASGLAAVSALVAGGARALAWDDGEAARGRAAALGATLRDFAADGFDGAAAMMLSPGIPRAVPAPHPAVARALADGVAIIGDIDLLAAARPEAGFIGITGTNGKSTTTALIHHVLEHAGVAAAAGGNLGAAALSLPPLGAGGWYVLEVSSYQLETISTVPWRVGVFTNLTPDHLDRYESLDAYAGAKARLIDGIAPAGTAIIGVDEAFGAELADRTEARGATVVRVSVEHPVEGGIWAEGSRLRDHSGILIDLAEAPALPGAHNAQNAGCAWAACRAAGLAPDAIAAGIRSFPGLRHRLQRVATLDGVLFVNDSKATNPDAAAKGLSSYDRIYWIAGGKPKEGGLEALDPYLARVRRAFLVGVGTPKFADYLAGRVCFERSGDIRTAVGAAFRAARDDGGEGVVLLSPACASFDQFANFEKRGDAFIAAVEDLRAGTALRNGTGGR